MKTDLSIDFYRCVYIFKKIFPYCNSLMQISHLVVCRRTLHIFLLVCRWWHWVFMLPQTRNKRSNRMTIIIYCYFLFAEKFSFQMQYVSSNWKPSRIEILASVWNFSRIEILASAWNFISLSIPLAIFLCLQLTRPTQTLPADPCLWARCQYPTLLGGHVCFHRSWLETLVSPCPPLSSGCYDHRILLFLPLASFSIHMCLFICVWKRFLESGYYGHTF